MVATELFVRTCHPPAERRIEDKTAYAYRSTKEIGDGKGKS